MNRRHQSLFSGRHLIVCGTCALLVMVLAGLGAAAQSQPPARKDERTLREEYRVISERNIFSRNRNRPPAPRDFGPPRQTEQYVVRGISKLVDGPYIAHIEERSGMTQVVVGDSIARGRIVNITETYVEFETDGQVRTVELGGNLVREDRYAGGFGSRGGPSPTTMPAVAGTGASETETPGTGAAATPDAASTVSDAVPGSPEDMIAKLKARRAAELGKKEE